MDLKEQYDRLLRYCTMKMGDKTIAEDIVQETFLKFWQSHSYQETGRRQAYLYAIARNLCVDEFRKRKHLNIDDYPQLPAAGRPELERIAEKVAVEEALARIPEDLRELVTLRYVSELSAADIGKMMGISRFAVNRRVKKGLELLKIEMEGGEENERQRTDQRAEDCVCVAGK